MATLQQPPRHPRRPAAGAYFPCGKSISGEQTIVVQPGLPWCLDCVLDYGKQGDFKVEMRVGVGIALLGRLADGFIYDPPWGFYADDRS